MANPGPEGPQDKVVGITCLTSGSILCEVKFLVITRLTLGLRSNSEGNVSHMAGEYMFDLGVKHM